MKQELFDFLMANLDNAYKKLIPLSVRDIRSLGMLCGVITVKTVLIQTQNITDDNVKTLFYFKFRLGHLRDVDKIQNNTMVYEQIKTYIKPDSHLWESGYRQSIDSMLKFIDSFLFVSGNFKDVPDDIIAINAEIAENADFKI